MRDLMQFYIMANGLLNALALPAEQFSPEQDSLGIAVERRFSVHFCMDRSGSCFFLGDRLGADGRSTASFHRNWLLANRISCGALQPVIGLNGEGEPSCWVRLPSGICSVPELLAAFDVLIEQMDRLTRIPASVR